MSSLEKKIVFYLLLFVFFPTNMFALMPPDDIAERNLEAKYIVPGKIVRKGKVLLPGKDKEQKAKTGVFVIKVLHVIKGYKKWNKGDKIHIVYRLPAKGKNGMKAEKLGMKQVKVHKDDIVVAYIKHSDFSDFYKPVLQGSSVAVIDN